MSGVYWSLSALSLLLPDFEHVNALVPVVGSSTTTQQQHTSPSPSSSSRTTTTTRQDSILLLDWLFSCFDERSGGFGGNTGHDGHILYTLSALQILAIANALDDPRLHRDRVVAFVASLQQPNGAFCGDAHGEIDTRFTYCALSCLALLNAMHHAVRVRQAAEFIMECQNLDGGFGAVVGGESHAGQVFCCVGALAIAESLDLLVDTVPTLAWWLAERQVDSGGLNGRPEKQADVCYSWWILSALSILGKLLWIHQDRLAGFILQCQDGDDGGIADRPDDMPDVFHTFFGIAGLSLLGHLHKDDTKFSFRSIDPLYALPTDVVQRLKLPGQVLSEQRRQCQVAERLAQYKVLTMS